LAIRTSSAAEIDRLLADLASNRHAQREAAVARLIVIGIRAVQRISRLALAHDASSEARAAAFRALEAIADPRALDPALQAAFEADEGVALAAIAVTRVFLETRRGVEVIDRLTEIATDRQRPVHRRLAAIDALSSLPPSTLGPLVTALRGDPQPEVAARVRLERGPDAAAAMIYIREAAEGRADFDPVALRRSLGRLPAGSAPGELSRLIDRLRTREAREPPASRGEWMAARAAAHVALARLGSRLALYDLRETLETADASLPVGFLTALTSVGDLSCLAAIASAYTRTQGEPNDWWHRHLADAFRGIVARESATARTPAVKRIKDRWPEAFAVLWPTRDPRRRKERRLI
jgi:hypothetical protein